MDRAIQAVDGKLTERAQIRKKMVSGMGGAGNGGSIESMGQWR